MTRLKLRNIIQSSLYHHHHHHHVKSRFCIESSRKSLSIWTQRRINQKFATFLFYNFGQRWKEIEMKGEHGALIWSETNWYSHEWFCRINLIDFVWIEKKKKIRRRKGIAWRMTKSKFLLVHGYVYWIN